MNISFIYVICFSLQICNKYSSHENFSQGIRFFVELSFTNSLKQLFNLIHNYVMSDG